MNLSTRKENHGLGEQTCGAWGEGEGVGWIGSLGVSRCNGFTMRSCCVALRTMSRYLECSTTMGEKIIFTCMYNWVPMLYSGKKKRSVLGEITIKNKLKKEKKKQSISFRAVNSMEYFSDQNKLVCYQALYQALRTQSCISLTPYPHSPDLFLPQLLDLFFAGVKEGNKGNPQEHPQSPDFRLDRVQHFLSHPAAFHDHNQVFKIQSQVLWQCQWDTWELTTGLPIPFKLTLLSHIMNQNFNSLNF